MRLLDLFRKKQTDNSTPIQHDAGEVWDDSDIVALKEYLAQGLDYETIAEHMGRTHNAVGSKVYRLRKKGELL